MNRLFSRQIRQSLTRGLRTLIHALLLAGLTPSPKMAEMVTRGAARI